MDYFPVDESSTAALPTCLTQVSVNLQGETLMAEPLRLVLQGVPKDDDVNPQREYISEKDIPIDTPLSMILLPNQWVLFLYDKQLFKKIANRSNFQANPYREICTFRTVNDVIYFIKLMGEKSDKNTSTRNNETGKIMKDPYLNLDVHDYIIMREGIEPIWEDPKNSCGGTFTIRMDHKNGYSTWTNFIMFLLGETLMSEPSKLVPSRETLMSGSSNQPPKLVPSRETLMSEPPKLVPSRETPIAEPSNPSREKNNENYYINGITVSYIINTFTGTTSDVDYSYIKIWDGKKDRNGDRFIGLMPPIIIEKIKNESLRYSLNVEKKDFNGKEIMSKLNSNRQHERKGKQFERGGFINSRKFSRK